MKRFLKILRTIWLNDEESSIYLNLLEYGISNITEISKYTKMHRTQVYRLLPNIIEQWFIFVVIKWKSKYYKPSNPEKINNIYQKMLENSKTDIDILKQKYINLEKKTSIIFNTWKKWIGNIYDDIVNTIPKWWVFYRITSEVDSDLIAKNFIPKSYKEKRDKKNIERFLIMSENVIKYKKPKLEREEKIITNDIDDFDDNITFTIYEDKISFIDFNTQTSILIESKELADFQKKIFKMFYKRL